MLPRFPRQANEQELWKHLRKNVTAQVSPLDRQQARAKASSFANALLVGYVLMIGLYLVSVGTYYQFLMASLLGVMALPLILNVGHEGIHQNLNGPSSGERRAKFVFALLGTSSYFWGLRHLSSHHVLANVIGHDLDIEQAKIIRLGEGQKYRWYHRYQHLYMPLAFLMYTIIWFFVRDLKDVNRRQYGVQTVKAIPKSELALLVLAKVWHFSFLLFFPILFGATLGQAVFSFFLFHLSASAVTTFILVSTHVGVDQEVVAPSEHGVLPNSWLMHTLKTTADFSIDSSLALQFFGGFNHHVAHHLFPNIPHLLYPQVTKTITEFCAEHSNKV